MFLSEVLSWKKQEDFFKAFIHFSFLKKISWFDGKAEVIQA